MKKIYAFLFLGLISFTTLLSQQYADSLDILLKERAERGKVPGFGVAIVNPESVLYCKGFGYADLEQKLPYTSSTLQNIGSISKTFIGLAIMKAVEEGKISLDTKINDVLPFKVIHPFHPDIDITLLHLASHTSGIKDGAVYEKVYVLTGEKEIDISLLSKREKKEFESMKPNKWMDMEDYLKKVLPKEGAWFKKKNFYKHAPGSTYKYSNIGAALAAYVIEIATGSTFESYTQKHILDPIGMQASGWHFEAVNMENHSQLYLPSGAQIPRYTLITFPDGGFITHIRDLALYVREAMRGFLGKSDLLSAESFQEMMKTHTGPKDTYGIFWEYNEQGKIGHNGSDPGVFTIMQFDPKTKLGVLLFTNTNLDKKKGSFDQMRETWQLLKKYGQKLSN